MRFQTDTLCHKAKDQAEHGDSDRCAPCVRTFRCLPVSLGAHRWSAKVQWIQSLSPGHRKYTNQIYLFMIGKGEESIGLAALRINAYWKAWRISFSVADAISPES
jgi:hypothetical protein